LPTGRTRPGVQDGVAAWYRLRPRLDAVTETAWTWPAARPTGRWTRACLLSSVFTVALGLFALVKLVPSGVWSGNDLSSPRRLPEPGVGPGIGGVSGSADSGTAREGRRARRASNLNNVNNISKVNMTGGMEGSGGMLETIDLHTVGRAAAPRKLAEEVARLVLVCGLPTG
jgi:hypothetical protein